MRHFFDMTGNGQPAKRRLRAALSEKLWDMCVCVWCWAPCAATHTKIRQENKRTFWSYINGQISSKILAKMTIKE